MAFYIDAGKNGSSGEIAYLTEKMHSSLSQKMD